MTEVRYFSIWGKETDKPDWDRAFRGISGGSVVRDSCQGLGQPMEEVYKLALSDSEFEIGTKRGKTIYSFVYILRNPRVHSPS